MRDVLLLDEAFPDRWHVVCRGPVFCNIFLAKIVLAGFKCLEGHRGVPVVVVLNGVKIIAPSVYRQISTPVVSRTSVSNCSTRIKGLNPVWPASQWRGQGRLLEVSFFPVMLREDGHLANDEG